MQPKVFNEKQDSSADLDFLGIFIPVRSDQEYCSKRGYQGNLGPEAGVLKTIMI